MKIINESTVFFKSCFGEQKIENKDVVLASYCTIIPNKSETLIYNNLSRELILLSETEANALRSVNSQKSDIIDYLKKSWFYIPRDISSIALSDQFSNMINLMQLPNEKGYCRYTIITTLECNARCYYCFQQGTEQQRMTLEVAEDVSKYIVKHSVPNKKINITWFGGEPLYNFEVMDLISKKIIAGNLQLESSMITNGFLFNEYLIEKALHYWNLKNVQITLDGTQEIYNRTKNYIYKDVNAFELVINNIELLLDNGINVSVRINLSPYNTDDLYKLIDFLSVRFSAYKKFSVYVHRLFQYGKNGDALNNSQLNENSIVSFSSLNEYILLKGLNTIGYINNHYKSNNCSADLNSALSITPIGKITKCRHFSDSEIIGNIYSDKIDDSLVNEWKIRQTYSDICDDCIIRIDCHRLQKCPDISPVCDRFQKKIEENKLCVKIRNTYNKWKKTRNLL